jgi:hypothetical protein
MQHRHINRQGFSMVAIDDMIERGNRADWVELRDSAQDPACVCRACGGSLCPALPPLEVLCRTTRCLDGSACSRQPPVDFQVTCTGPGWW